MKNTFIIAVCIFWGFVIAVISAGYIVKQNRIAQEDMQKKYVDSLKQITESLVKTNQGNTTTTSQQAQVVTKGEGVKNVSVSKTPTNVGQAPSTVTSPKIVSNQNSLTMDIVAKHNSQNDCWIVINRKVYSVTSYIPMHPGGAKRIVRLCGADATSGYDGQGHSSYANSLLGSYLVGPLQ
ncbi:MAG: cytochrome b5 domain-containing protein [Candidatus Pacebacteria bacterium]|nr:cytochrome b5 domain-containing protein [Candidatus Paceibacterota bacterium]